MYRILEPSNGKLVLWGPILFAQASQLQVVKHLQAS